MEYGRDFEGPPGIIDEIPHIVRTKGNLGNACNNAIYMRPAEFTCERSTA